MGRQTIGRLPVGTVIGVLLVFIISPLFLIWERNLLEGPWRNWPVLTAPLITVGFWVTIGYALWMHFKSRHRWFLPVGISLVVVSSMLLFSVGPVLAESVALLGILALAAVASWRDGEWWDRALFTSFFFGLLIFYGLLYYGARR